VTIELTCVQNLEVPIIFSHNEFCGSITWIIPMSVENRFRPPLLPSYNWRACTVASRRSLQKLSWIKNY